MKDKAVIEAIARRDEQAVSAVINKYSRLLWPIAGAVLELSLIHISEPTRRS